MRYARCLGWGLASISIGSVLALGALSARPRTEAIARDPVSHAPNPEGSAGVTPPAAVPTPPAAHVTDKRDNRRPKLDTPIEPWTGEDLAPKVAASQALLMKVDTSDPWDPRVHPHYEPARELHPYEEVYGRPPTR